MLVGKFLDDMRLRQRLLNRYRHRVTRALAQVHQSQHTVFDANEAHFELLGARLGEALVQMALDLLARFCAALIRNLLSLRWRGALARCHLQLRFLGLCR